MINVTGKELGFYDIHDDIVKITKFYAVDAAENDAPKYKLSWQKGRWVVENGLNCFAPNNDAYPLCRGNGQEKCRNCSIYEDYEDYNSPYQD